MPGKRRFGRVRELPSGRWQARYKGPDGIDRPAPRTFDSKTSAERWLTLTEAEIIQGDWIDPDAGRVLFGNYARDWIEERPNLRPKTIQLYLYLLRSHLAPAFGARAMADIRESDVRRWRKNLLDAQVSAVTLAKAYRLLKAIFNTAVDDGLIRRNPCRIKGAGQEKSPERPVLTVPRSTPWPTRCPIGTAPLCCSPFSAACAGVSWPRCAGPTSTSRPVPSGFPGSSASNAAAGSRSGRPSRTPVTGPLPFPR
jgi:hypothetical protein